MRAMAPTLDRPSADSRHSPGSEDGGSTDLLGASPVAQLRCDPYSQRGDEHDEPQSHEDPGVGCPTDQENGDAGEIGDDRPLQPPLKRASCHRYIVAAVGRTDPANGDGPEVSRIDGPKLGRPLLRLSLGPVRFPLQMSRGRGTMSPVASRIGRFPGL